ncbi:unnamed protein product [Parajaminaea phylloscopi]
MGYALWLVPDSNDPSTDILRGWQEELRTTIDTASASFPPHATLLSGLSADPSAIWEQTQQVMDSWRRQGQRQVKCRLQDLVTNGLYFQCIVLALEKSEALVELYGQAREVCDKRSQGREGEVDTSLRSRPPYFPHVSLVYAHIDRAEAQTRIDAIKKGRSVVSVADGSQIELHPVSGRQQQQPVLDVVFTKVQLWDCNGEVSTWHKLDSLAL